LALRLTLLHLLCAPTATIRITRTRARLTVTTDRVGSPAVFSSELVRGSTDLLDAPAFTAARAFMPGPASGLVQFLVAPPTSDAARHAVTFMVAAASAVEGTSAAAVEGASTVEGVRTAGEADTGKLRP
jgi:hypothetical protein